MTIYLQVVVLAYTWGVRDTDWGGTPNTSHDEEAKTSRESRQRKELNSARLW